MHLAHVTGAKKRAMRANKRAIRGHPRTPAQVTQHPGPTHVSLLAERFVFII